VSIPKETLLHAYRSMKTIREFEERVHAEIMNGQIPGFTHYIRVKKPTRLPSAPISMKATPLSVRTGVTAIVLPRAPTSPA